MTEGYPEDRVFNRKAISAKLDSIRGKTLGEIDSKNILNRASEIQKITGIAGDVIEQSVLGCGPDSEQRPDLLVDGVPTELKTIGVRIKSGRNGPIYEAKEPMTVTAVSIATISGEEFIESNFWHKLSHLLIVFYEYKSETTVPASCYADFPVLGYKFYVFSNDEREALEHDWTVVRDFVSELKAMPRPEMEYGRLSHELRPVLSVIDTAPKYPNPPRFRLKRNFVTSIVQQSLTDEDEPVTTALFSELDMTCHAMTMSYGELTIGELAHRFGIKKISKSTAACIISRMFEDDNCRINDVEMFKRIGLNVKTIKLSQEGGRTEDMKLFPLDFGEISMDSVTFEESEFYEYFSEHQFLCPIFEESDAKGKIEESIFVGFKRLAFPEEFIQDEVKRTWEEVRRTVLNGELRCDTVLNAEGNPVINKSGEPRTRVNLPKSKHYEVFVRGGGADATDKIELIPGVFALRQYVWIKGRTIVKLLENHKLL